MNHAEVVIARQAIEEGRGLVVIVNKMDLLRGNKNSLLDKVLEAVPQEIQTVIPQVCFSFEANYTYCPWCIIQLLLGVSCDL